MTSTHWIIGCKKSFFDSQAFDKNSIRLPKRRYIHDIVSEFRDYETNGTFLTSLHENRGIQLNSFLFQNNNKVLMSHKENEEKNKLLITPMQCTAKHNLLNNIPNLLFVEMFQDDIFSRWFTLKHKKSQGKWSKGLKKLQDNTEDYGLQVSSSMQHHSIASHFKKPIVIKRDQVFILSFEIQYPSSYECGSSSITLYSKQTLTKWNVLSRVQIAKELPSSIQFAADICGNRLSLHWNLKRHNPFNNEWVEHHLSPAPTILKTQNVSTLYTLKVSPNDSFTVLVNHQVISQGTFHKNLVPPLESNEQPFLFLTKFDYLLTLATNHFNAFRVSPWFISLMQTTIFKLKTFLCRQQEIKHNPLLFLEKIIYLSHDMKILFNITKYAILLQIQKNSKLHLTEH